MWQETLLALGAIVVALAIRPWRAFVAGGPPWPAVVLCALMPVLWCTDRLTHAPLLQPMSGACLLVLMTGWPLAVLAFVPIGVAAAVVGGLPWAEALHRAVWLGLVPATFAMLLGAAVRRWLPRHLMVYILGRGFFVAVIALALAGWLGHAVDGAAPGLRSADVMIGRWLGAWGEAFITGMLTAIFVVHRPQWLATYADRLYLPR